MNTASGERDQKQELIHWLVGEAVRAGMESPLRETILDAVEQAGEEDGPTEMQITSSEAAATEDESEAAATEDEEAEATESDGTRLAVRAIQGLTVFVVMFVVLYVSLKWVTSDEER